MSRWRFAMILALSWGLQACGGSSDRSGEPLSAAASLGQEIFHDVTLSASGRMSCATCHDPKRGHASPFSTPVAFGGRGFPGDQSEQVSGLRVPPSIRYLKFNSSFKWDAQGMPVGGFFWDGRANSLAEQAKKPFLGANEMGNVDAQEVISRLSHSPYAKRFQQVFGDNIFADPQTAFERVAYALERYQKEDKEFAPFSSKFDAVNAGLAVFTAQELRGLTWFNRADKGNCAACHPSTKPDDAPGALFTDFSYDSLGVPRNAAIAANHNSAFFDMGLCGPERADLLQRTDLCGKFKVPSLRNVALRTRFFHNGQFDNLTDVVRFYVTRDTQASLWYRLDVYDDLPSNLRTNVNVTEAPYNRQRNEKAALTESEITDLVVFLQTLTDGFTP
jgi:cytochrome c peroxidase